PRLGAKPARGPGNRGKRTAPPPISRLAKGEKSGHLFARRLGRETVELLELARRQDALFQETTRNPALETREIGIVLGLGNDVLPVVIPSSRRSGVTTDLEEMTEKGAEFPFPHVLDHRRLRHVVEHVL